MTCSRVTETEARAPARPGNHLDEAALASLRRSRRILVLGSSGAGKSELSRDLAEILGIAAIHLDDHFWQPDRQPRGEREWREIVKELAARESWIMDGTYERSLDLRLPRAEAIILLECPSEICLERVLRRESEGPRPVRHDRSSQSPHPIDPHHVQYISQYASVTRPFVLGCIERHGRGKTVVVVQAPEAVGPFLSALRQAAT